MEIKINDRIILGNYKKFGNLQALIDNLVFKEHEKGQVVTKIMIDGKEFADHTSIKYNTTPIEQVSSLVILSENPFNLAKNCYEVALESQSELLIRLNKVVKCFKTGYLQGGEAEASAFYDQLSTFIQLLIKPMELLDLETTLISFENTPLSEHIEILYSAVREMESKQLMLTPEQYSQWLTNQFKPLIHKWERIIRYFLHEISKIR